MKDDLLLHKWMEGTLSPEELQAFQARPEFEALERIRQETDQWSPPSIDVETMLQQVLASKPESPETKVISMRNRWLIPAAIAAAVALIMTFVFWPSPTAPTVYLARASEQPIITLPEGSKVHLNAGSSLKVFEDEFDAERRMILAGEGWFDVEKGNEFRVKTSSGTVTVLGTQFNIRDRDGSFEVSCQSGKVSVMLSDGQESILEAGDAVRFTNGTLEQERTQTEQPSWMSGVTRLRSVPLSDVFAELERIFDVQFEADEVDLSTILTCNFQHQDLSLALASCLSALPLEFEIAGSEVRVRPSPTAN